MTRPKGSKNKPKMSDIRGEMLLQGFDFIPEWLKCYQLLHPEFQAKMLAEILPLVFGTEPDEDMPE